MTMNKKLTRNKTDKMLAGVCSGIAKYFDIDPTIVRVAYVLLTFFMACFPGILMYIILLLIMPNEE